MQRQVSRGAASVLPPEDVARVRAVLYLNGLRGADLEDAAQDVQLRVLERAPNDLRSPGAWASTVATRVALDRHRRAATSRRLLSRLGNSADTHILDQDTATVLAVREALADLTPDLRAIVVLRGTVLEIRHGDGAAAGGIPYVLGRVYVTEAIRGASGDLWAFDYAVGDGTSTSSVPAGRPWQTGQRVLLFLASSTGAVHEHLTPHHEQVVGGGQGRYLLNGSQLADAPFTLDAVRIQAR